MPALRNLLRFLMFVALAALALPAVADNKNFSVAVPSSLSPGTGVFVDVTFTNNATGNSTINSLELDVTSGGLAITAAVVKGTTIAGTTTSTSAVFTNLSPVKRGQSITIRLTANVSVSNCANGAVTWDAHAWSGSPTNPSATFVLNPTPIATTTITAGCTLSFLKQPAGTLVGDITTSKGSDPMGDPVTVVRYQANGTVDPSLSGVTLTIKSGPAGATISGATSSLGAFPGWASFPSLKLSALGTYVLTATAASLSVDSTSFSVFNGVLGCASTDNFAGNTALDPDGTQTLFLGTPDWALRRGPNWDDTTGANCVKVDYTVNFDPNTNTASVLWDKSTGQHASFKYVLLWTPVAVNSTTGWTAIQPALSWGVTNPVIGTSDYVPALMCKGDDLTQGQAILPTIPNAPPFNDATKYPPAQYPQYQPGQLAKMCIAQQGQTSVGVDGSGNVIVQYWDEVIDEADGFINFNP